MKISVLLTVAKLCLVAGSSTSDPVCLSEGCDGSREYCDSSIGACRAAKSDSECYNATIALFQDGCGAGYECVDDLCRVSADPVDGRTCHIICSAGKFCENGTTECRSPAYENECFNLATGKFEDGCDEGFFCSFNKCVDTDDSDNTSASGDAGTSSSVADTSTTSGANAEIITSTGASTSTSASADDVGSPATDISNTSGANTETVMLITALVLVVVGALSY